MNSPFESPVGLVRGTTDALPRDYARLADLEHGLLAAFRAAGYVRLRTPVLERSELHERKSGVRIVSKLDMTAQEGVCLRPEFTAGIVRAFAFAAEPPALPWRVCYSGPVFRREEDGDDRLREFHQVGVELIGAERPSADAEVIRLAVSALKRASGVDDASIRIGHVGLVREILERSGLPAPVQMRLVERLARTVNAEEQERAVDAELAPAHDATAPPGPSGGGVERLFASLYPVVVGRRTGDEIVGRLRRKWELGHTLREQVDHVKKLVHALADLHGPIVEVLRRLEREFVESAPASVRAIRGLVDSLDLRGVDLSRVTLDLGFGRGIGFYSQMMFVLLVDTPEGPVEVCGGGRYDGLTRELGGDRDDRGVGFAFGLERLDEAIRARGESAETPSPQGFLIAAEDPERAKDLLRSIDRLAFLGVPMIYDGETPPERRVEAAKRLGLEGLIVDRGDGPRLVDLATGVETVVEFEAFLLNHFQSRLLES